MIKTLGSCLSTNSLDELLNSLNIFLLIQSFIEHIDDWVLLNDSFFKSKSKSRWQRIWFAYKQFFLEK